MGPPRLFETVVFTDHGVGLRDILDQRRYSTWDEAVAGHKEAVEKVRQTGMRDEIALHSKKETS